MCIFGQRLREERLDLGLTQGKLAEIGGVALRAQQNYESGERAPDLRYLERISRIGVDVNYVVTGNRVSTVVEYNEKPDAIDSILDVRLIERILVSIRGSLDSGKYSNLSERTQAQAITILYRRFRTTLKNETLSESAVSATLDALTLKARDNDNDRGLN